MKAFISLLLIFAAFSASARVPVEDRSQPATSTQQPQPVAPGDSLPPPVARPDLFGKLQLLQDEVMELRGMVEQLSNEVRLLKQRQADDYMDLDRRIGAGAGATAPSTTAARPSTPPRAATPATPATPRPATASADYEVNHYSAAYGLLKDGKIPEATSALQRHIKDFPNGKYTANAYYWLGEIYLLENKLSPAKSAFNKIVEDYPVHRKAPDATFKLGKVLHLMGDNAAAKAMLNRAVQSGGTAGNLAEKYLSDNF